MLGQYIGRKVRRISLNVRKPDGKYYQLFTVYEDNDYASDRLSVPVDPKTGIYRLRCDISSNDKDSVYYVVEDKIVITKEMVDNPAGKIVVSGTPIHPLCESYVAENDGKEILIPKDEHFKDEIKTVLPVFCASCFAACFLPKEPIKDLINEQVKGQIKELSLKCLSFDLSLHDRYWGAVIFVRSNPYFSMIDFREDAKRPGLYFRTYYRAGRIIPLNIIVTGKDKKGNIWGEERFVTQHNGFLSHFDFKQQYGLIDIKVLDPNGILIDYYTDVTFIHSIDIAMSVMTKKVEYKDNAGNVKSINRYSSERHIIGKDEPIKSLMDTSEEFSYKRFEDALDFVFFDGNKSNQKYNRERAVNVVSRILKSSQMECYIVDPYFSGFEITDFVLPAVERMNVKIHILSSKEGLSSRQSEVRKTDGMKAYDAKQHLANCISELNSKGINDIECRLMRGKPVSHDRFIVADNNAWLVGCSLNELGVRAASVVRVPHEYAPKIIGQIKSWWADESITEVL